jgi:hypothetical protein
MGARPNFKFTPDEQELKCMLMPAAFAPLPNAWGEKGWTIARLAELSIPDLKLALETAWRHATAKKHRRTGRQGPVRL